MGAKFRKESAACSRGLIDLRRSAHLEQLGCHRLVDRMLFKMAQIEDDDDAPLNLEEDLEYSPGGIDVIQQILAKWGATNVRTVFPDVLLQV